METESEVPVWKDAAIVRVKLENFITYDSVELFPGPSLNVVIGPNGSGKSALVCGICLGLGGEPKLLGRARDIREFVKNGKQQGTIEIELYQSEGDNVVLRRDITLDNKSLWHLNGRVATKNAVKDKIKELNIRVDNLCQFLPQDRVVEFAKLNPQDRLKQTQLSIGGEEMQVKHRNLIQAQKDLNTSEAAQEAQKNAITQLENRNKAIESDVNKYREREQSETEKDVLQNKRAWIEYENALGSYTEAKEDRDRVTEQLREVEAESEPMMQQATQLKKDVLACKHAKDKTLVAANKKLEKCNKLEDKLDDLSENIRETQEEIEIKRNDERKTKDTIKRFKDDIAAIEERLANSSNNKEECLEKVANLKKESRNLNIEIQRDERSNAEIRDSMDNIKRDKGEAESKLKKLNDTKLNMIRCLKSQNPDAYQATLWLRDHRHMFKEEVFEPIITIIRAHNPSLHAHLIEQAIPKKSQVAFLFTNDDDHNLFRDEVRQKLHLRVNTAIAPVPSDTGVNSPGDLSELGVENYISELYTAPPPVMRHLNKKFFHKTIAIGTGLGKNTEKLLRAGVKTFYSDGDMYQSKHSKYGDRGVVSTVQTHSTNSIYLKHVAADPNELLYLQNQLKDIDDALQQKQQEFDGQSENLRNKRKEISSIKIEIENVKKILAEDSKLAARKSGLESRLNALDRPCDMEEEERKSKEKIKKINRNRYNVCQELTAELKQSCQLAEEGTELSLRHIVAKERELTASQRSRELREQLSELTNKRAKLVDTVTKAKAEARRLMKIAASKIDISRPEVRQAFLLLPNTIEEIDRQIAEKEALLNCVQSIDKDIVIQYDNRVLEIAEKITELDEMQKSVSENQEKIEDLKQTWLEPLKSMVEAISDKFSTFFQYLDCAGEVSLAEHNNYEEYGFDIKVQFRQSAELSKLDHQRQSGGERSVSTMLYLMAMQDVNSCPFRVVDEINQGMDPINERRVFSIISQTATHAGTSQYFLITPKLLPSLSFTEHMTVLCVFNGPSMVDHTEWNLSDFVDRRMAISA